MVRPQVLTWFREQALLIGARPLCQLLFTGRETEISSRPPNIMDISLKVRLLGKKLCLVYQRLMASRLDDPSLMEGQRAEAAATKAAPVADKDEFDLTDRRNTPGSLIRGMIASHIRQIIHIIHFFLC